MLGEIVHNVFPPKNLLISWAEIWDIGQICNMGYNIRVFLVVKNELFLPLIAVYIRSECVPLKVQ